MANEITVQGTLTIYKPAVMVSPGISLTFPSTQFTMTGSVYIGPTDMLVATSATAIPLGPVTQPHWAWFYNTDTVNYVTIFNGASGAVLLRLYPGEATPGGVPLDITCTPYAQANTAAIYMQYMIAQY